LVDVPVGFNTFVFFSVVYDDFLLLAGVVAFGVHGGHGFWDSVSASGYNGLKACVVERV
jgi:hypothetical protein